MKLHRYTERELALAISISTSLRQTLLNLNVAAFGGNYDVLRKAIDHFDLDTSHFKGQAMEQGSSLETPKSPGGISHTQFEHLFVQAQTAIAA